MIETPQGVERTHNRNSSSSNIFTESPESMYKGGDSEKGDIRRH